MEPRYETRETLIDSRGIYAGPSQRVVQAEFILAIWVPRLTSNDNQKHSKTVKNRGENPGAHRHRFENTIEIIKVDQNDKGTLKSTIYFYSPIFPCSADLKNSPSSVSANESQD